MLSAGMTEHDDGAEMEPADEGSLGLPMGPGKKVSAERVWQLLGEGAESKYLDYKEALDLDQRRDVVELAKDIAAFSAEGGHVVVGATNEGQPSSRFDEVHARKFDEANVRQKLSRYLAGAYDIRCAFHTRDGHWFAVIGISPSLDGLMVFRADGTYPAVSGRGDEVVFRAGDVFVRDGTRSSRWQQHHVREFIERAVRKQKEAWLAEHRSEIVKSVRAAVGAEAIRIPALTFSWQVDVDGFEAALIEMLRAGDIVPIRLLVERMPREAAGLLSSSDVPQWTTVLDRAAIMAGVAIRVGVPEVERLAVEVLRWLYDDVLDRARRGSIDLQAASDLWLRVLLRVLVVGGLAVRKRAWGAVRALANVRIDDAIHRGASWWWIRHAQVMATRAGLLGGGRSNRSQAPVLLFQSLDVARELPPLAADLDPDDDRYLTSMAQFDFLAAASVIAEEESLELDHWYPNFSLLGAERVEPAAELLIADKEARSILFPLDDEDLAKTLASMNSAAKKEASWTSFWGDWRSAPVKELLDRYPQTT